MSKELNTDSPIGQKLIGIRKMTKRELSKEGWEVGYHHGAPTVMVFEDGTLVYASQDEEGNGPGALFGQLKDGTSFYLMVK